MSHAVFFLIVFLTAVVSDGWVGTRLRKSKRSCLTIVACVDGTDYFKVAGGVFTHTHGTYSEVGTHSGCSGGVVPGGGFYVDGTARAAGSSFSVPISALNSFTKIAGRGSVTTSASNQIVINDVDPSSDVYTIRICR